MRDPHSGVTVVYYDLGISSMTKYRYRYKVFEPHT